MADQVTRTRPVGSAVQAGSALRTAPRPPQEPTVSDQGVVQLRGQSYVMVRRRLQELRKDHPNWRIVTESIELGENYATFKATILDESGTVLATGHDRAFGENCVPLAETGAVGRALTYVGYGSDDLLERILEESEEQ